jgi:hypothetical protein
MDTYQLRAIQHPSAAAALLESWACSQNIMPADERRQPVLQIKVYNEDGEMTAAATCVHTVHHGWQQCS